MHPHSIPQNAVSATGVLKNFNTIEDFKNADKTALFNQLADEIWKSIVEDKSTALLNRFLVITFADLKKYKYFYWFAFPAFAAKPAWEIDGEWQSAEDALDADKVRRPLSPSFPDSQPVSPALRNPDAAPCLPPPLLPRPHP